MGKINVDEDIVLIEKFLAAVLGLEDNEACGAVKKKTAKHHKYASKRFFFVSHLLFG